MFVAFYLKVVYQHLLNPLATVDFANNKNYIIMLPRWTYWEWQRWYAQQSNPKQKQRQDKSRRKLVGYGWMLPRNEQYMVVEVEGKGNKPPRMGLVTCKHGDCLLVHFEDDRVERRDISSVVQREIALQPPQYQ